LFAYGLLRTFGFCREYCGRDHPKTVASATNPRSFITSSHSQCRFLGRARAGPQQLSRRYKNRSVKSEHPNSDRPTTQPCFPACACPSITNGVLEVPARLTQLAGSSKNPKQQLQTDLPDSLQRSNYNDPSTMAGRKPLPARSFTIKIGKQFQRTVAPCGSSCQC
jgi:hypothetical protein